MTEYKGHESWNAWNVALWIGNNSELYWPAVRALRSHPHRQGSDQGVVQETGLRNCRR